MHFNMGKSIVQEEADCSANSILLKLFQAA